MVVGWLADDVLASLLLSVGERGCQDTGSRAGGLREGRRQERKGDEMGGERIHRWEESVQWRFANFENRGCPNALVARLRVQRSRPSKLRSLSDKISL